MSPDTLRKHARDRADLGVGRKKHPALALERFQVWLVAAVATCSLPFK